EWLRMAKHSIASLLPRFGSTRMVSEYLAKFYLPASRQGRRYAESNFENARKLAQWKTLVRSNWPKAGLRRLDTPMKNVPFGEGVRFQLAVRMGSLKPEDVVLELVIGRQTDAESKRDTRRYRFEWEGVMTDQGEHSFALHITPEMCGKLEYRVRMYPYHELLTHPFEMGMMRWL
ncbi:MAG: DUF3417 domain-containing protein, partial [Betaproteobacteria bacterium]